MISVLIATRNRPSQIKNCIRSILKNNFKNFEIIIVDQSENSETFKVIKKYNLKRILYLRTKKVGKSKALNIAINKAKGEILAFTDDDCIVDSDWLREITKAYKLYPQVGGVFGNTYSYNPKEHPKEICSSTFVEKQIHLHRNPSVVHYRKIGIGNNMTIKKKTFQECGFFKEWLGPGTLGLGGGEESELIFRLLKNKVPLLTCPSIVVYHNKWLSISQESVLQTRYTAGLIAFQAYYLVRGSRYQALKFLRVRLAERFPNMIKEIFWKFKFLLKDLYFLILEIWSVIKGLCIGFFMALMGK
jgi:GT2 family glycosyltransferase